MNKPEKITVKLMAVAQILAITLLAACTPGLSAIACHTTLRAGATLLDKVLFVADKLEWDQEGKPPYLSGMRGMLERSLDEAALFYLDYLWQRRVTLPVVHPWMIEARQQLRSSPNRPLSQL